MKEVYFITQHYEDDGLSFTNVFKELAIRFKKAGYEVTFVTGTQNKESHVEEVPYGLISRFKLLNPPAFGMFVNSLLFSWYIREYVKAKEIDDNTIIIANGPASLGLPKKSFILRVGDQPPRKFNDNLSVMRWQKWQTKTGRNIHCMLQRLLEIFFMPKAKSYIYSSVTNLEDFNNEYTLPRAPVFIPRSGVNCSDMKGGKNMKLAKKSILFVGSGDERIRKGIRDLEDSLPHIFDEFEDCKLIHVGKKFDWELYIRHEDRLISVGKVPHKKMKDYYKSASLLVSTSLSEGFPNVILEAMAAGCPILTSDIDGVHEYLTHMKSAYIYKRGDTVELTQGLYYMLNNPKKAKEMAKQAQKDVQKLDYDNYFEKLMGFIKTGESINILK